MRFCFQSSVTEVETLQRKQAQFEEALEAQVDQLDQVENLAQKMIQQKHYDSDSIRTKSRALANRSALTRLCLFFSDLSDMDEELSHVKLCRWTRLQQQSRTRHRALDRSQQLQNFSSSTYQVSCCPLLSVLCRLLLWCNGQSSRCVPGSTSAAPWRWMRTGGNRPTFRRSC